MAMEDGGGVLMVSLNTLEVLADDVVDNLAIDIDLDFFGGFIVNVTFFLVVDGEVVEGYDWLDFTS